MTAGVLASTCATLGQAAQARQLSGVQHVGSAAADWAVSVATTQEAVYVAGSTYGSVQGQAYQGDRDVFLSKYTPAGVHVWTREYGKTTNDDLAAMSLYAGDVYLAGTTSVDAADPLSDRAAFVYKINGDGLLRWARELGPSSVVNARGLAVGGAGVFVGRDSNRGQFLTRLETMHGRVKWDKSVGRSSTQEKGLALNGPTLYVGDTADDVSRVRAFTATSGAALWTRTIGARRTSLHALAAGGGRVYAAGETRASLTGQNPAGAEDAWVRTFTRSGTVAWTRQFGTPTFDAAYGVSLHGGAVYVAGVTDGALSGASAGATDAFVQRLSLAGSTEWTRQLGSSASDYGAAVSGGPLGVYLVGQAGAALPGATPLGDLDGFLARYVGWRPDALGRLGTQPWRGEDVYAPVSQTVGGSIRRGATVTFWLRAVNDGESTDRLQVQGCTNPAGLTVKYFKRATDVTAKVHAGTFRSASLAPGASVALKVLVKAGQGAPLATANCPVIVSSRTSPIVTDTFTFQMSVSR